MRRVAVSVLLVALFVSLVGFVVHRRIGGGHTPAELVTDADSDEASATEDTSADGATSEGTTAEATTAEGTAEGSIAEGSIAEGSIAEGSIAEGSTADGSTAEGTTAEGTTEGTTEGSTAEAMTAEGTTAEGTTAGGTTAEGTAAEGTTAGTTAAATTAGTPEATTATPAAATGALLDRPLRVIATHWEVAAPIVLAGGEGRELARAGLRQELRVTTSAAQIEEALARGGDEENGADVAILPLSMWVASYEHLAALETEAFFVAAWSRGADVFFTGPDVTVGTQTSFAIAGTRGSRESIALLTLLDAMGTPADRARFVASDDPGAPFAASERESPELELRARGRLAWLSTADASRLSAWVVVAPRGFVRAHQPALVAWSGAWLRGVDRLASDVPTAARTIAQIQGAPPLVELLRRLGQIESAPLAEQAALAGLAGPRALTLESMFRRTWAVERALGILSGPPPATAPIATGTLATLARRQTTPASAAAAYRAPTTPRTLLTFPIAMPRNTRDTTALANVEARLGFAASTFPRSGLELVVTRAQSAAARTLVEGLVAREGLDPARVTITTGASPGLRVLAPE